MGLLSSGLKIGEAIAVWLNPERREKAILRGAIESGDELLAIKDAMILRSNGSFKASRNMKRQRTLCAEIFKRLKPHPYLHSRFW